MPHRTTEKLITTLQNRALYPHPVEAFEVVETHISWVLLSGPFAYKIKKPLELAFLDFSTLEKRRHFCEAELRLNRRLAPQLYRDVVPITGSIERPKLGGPGPALEYAVKMVQFDQDGLLSRMIARGKLGGAHIDRLAEEVAGFHQRIAVAEPTGPYGLPEKVHAPVRQNVMQIRPLLEDPEDIATLARLEVWLEEELERRASTLSERLARGFVRECHGDMHLGNMVQMDDRLIIFDCIEFNDYLRWIDVMSEVAFAVMDLEDRGRPDFGHRFLNHYLEHTGDYAGLGMLRYYQTYRAMVRAKVCALRLGQSDLDAQERSEVWEAFHGYIDLAARYTQSTSPVLVITRGPSGVGKSTMARCLVETLGAVQVRSDVERKRLFGLPPDAASGSRLGEAIYGPGATERVYARLAELAETLLEAGFSVIADATFLKTAQRDRFRELAERLRVPLVVLDLRASEQVLRARVERRQEGRADASEAGLDVLDFQLASAEGLRPAERSLAITVDVEAEPDLDNVAREIRGRAAAGQAPVRGLRRPSSAYEREKS
jgi:aminoglycoside phosphotransferase family enzyme/predicted kinase